MNIQEKIDQLSEKDHAVLKSIMQEGWEKFGDDLYTEQDIAPTVKKVAEKALNEEAHRFTDAERGKIRAALETGEYDKRVKVEDPEVAKELEEYVDKRIQEEIKKGNLNKPEHYEKKD